MNQQALARKWRPKFFKDLVAQDHVVKALQHALSAQSLHHAYILAGTRGVGKTTIARIFAKALNCEQGIIREPCGVCTSCQFIDQGRMVDLFEIDAASNTGVDHIREVLENARYAPSAGRYKIYIIDEVHMLSKSAFNAMLKTLEEPPTHIKFILATTDPQKIPMTILSRCLQFTFRHITDEKIANHLEYILKEEGIVFESEAIRSISRSARGSMRDALSLTDQAIAHGEGSIRQTDVVMMLGVMDHTQLLNLLQAFVEKRTDDTLRASEDLLRKGVSGEVILAELAEAFQKICLLHQLKNPPEELQPWSNLTLTVSLADAHVYYQMAVQARRDFMFAPNEYIGVNMALLRMIALQSFYDDQDHQQAQSITPEKQQATKNHTEVNPEQNLTNDPSKKEEPPESQEQLEHVNHDTPEMRHKLKEKNHDAWLKTVEQLTPSLGMARMLLQHASFISYQDHLLTLNVAKDYESLGSRQNVQAIEQALEKLWGEHLMIRLEWSNDSHQTMMPTPSQQKEQKQKQKHHSFMDHLKSDATIQALHHYFGAKVIEESIEAR